MSHKPSIHVVFDTNAIWAGTAHQFLSPAVSKLIKTHSAAPSLDIHWYVPPIVRYEREYQMANEAKKLVPSLNKAERLIGSPLGITIDVLTARVQQIIENQIEDHGIKVPDFDASTAKWDDVINRAAFRLPPFEAGDKEKGFRDAVILEVFCQLYKALGISKPNQLVLVSSDNLLREAVSLRLGDQPEVVLHENLEALVTSIVALSAELDQKLAQEIVITARRFLNENMTVGRLSKMVFDKFGDKLRAVPGGGSATKWQLAWGETALVGKQETGLKFQTTILIQASAQRTIQVSPLIQDTAQTNFAANTTVTTLSNAPYVVFSTSVSTPPSAGTYITTSRSPGLVTQNSNSVISPESTRTVNSIGRHWLRLTWSAKLAEEGILIDFEPGAVEYDEVIWE